MALTTFAEKMFDAGFVCVPTGHNKEPLITYSHWRTAKPSKDVISNAFNSRQHVAMAVLMGLGGLNCIDVDSKNSSNPEFAETVLAAIEPLNFSHKLYAEKTPSGGLHFWYKTAYPIADYILAKESNDFDPEAPASAIIENLTFGRLCTIAPSPNYKQIFGDIFNLQELTANETELLRIICMAFDDTPQQIAEPEYQPSSKTPGDDFAETVSLTEMTNILEGAGYRKLGSSTANLLAFNRPGAKNPKGIDATIKVKTRTFRAFSTSIAEFKTDKGYNFFSVYGTLVHGGNFAKAAAELANKGFGKKEEKRPSSASEHTTTSDEDKSLLSMVKWFDINKKTDYEFFLDVVVREGDEYNPYANVTTTPFGGAGMIIAFSGLAKSRKSSLMSSLAAAAISGRRTLVWDYKVPANAVWFDTEQGEYYFERTQRNILKQAGFSKNPDNYQAGPLRRFSYKERRQIISEYLDANPETNLVFIDGIVDLVKDKNSITEAAEILQLLMEWSDKGRLVCVVIHTNSADSNKMTGSVGSELVKKADGVFLVKIDGEDDKICHVRNTEARGPRVNAFSFKVDEYNIPFMMNEPMKIENQPQPIPPSKTRMAEEDVPF
jgi:hypothetical protein